MRSWHGAMFSVVMLGCTSGEVHRPESAASVARPAPLMVDSARPMSEMVAAFQRGLRPITSLQNASASRDALVRRFVTAIASRDTAALGDMLISRAEFAHLYFPGSALSAAPYEMDPALAWFQMQLENERGMRQSLRAFGGRPVEYRAHECAPSRQEGESRVWRDCRLTWRTAEGVITQRAFMSIIEHNGQFKFFSYANRLPQQP